MNTAASPSRPPQENFGTIHSCHIDRHLAAPGRSVHTKNSPNALFSVNEVAWLEENQGRGCELLYMRPAEPNTTGDHYVSFNRATFALSTLAFHGGKWSRWADDYAVLGD